ncbi:cytochrome P450 [Lipomyces oligophaga]|uniref:cytochrome P450 n=1 Tax=Lipomyces oligophaga TaxID=45792 RepID=UPI0034CF676D
MNELYRRSIRIPGFDGPRGYPLIGNIPQIRNNASEQYRTWSEKYGPIFQVQLGNKPVLVVNSAEMAHKVFITNTQATNSRPMFYTFHSVVSSTAGFTIGTSPFNDSLKRRRKAAASALNRNAIHTYAPFIDLETKEFIADAYRIGKRGSAAFDPVPLIQRLSLNLSLTLNWGTRIESLDNELFEEITEVEEYISRFRSTTSNWQDYVPLLRWNLLGKSSALAREMRARRDVYINRLNEELKQRIAEGTYEPCIQANVLLDPEAKLDEEELKSISLTMVAGGLDTITTFVSWALAVLSVRPDIQRKAYEAICQLYTPEQMLCDPFDDQKCKYVANLVKEFLRSFPPLRLALPRETTREIMVEGRKIPAGTTIFLNAWACNMDPKEFKNPYEFRPDRFIENKSIFSYGQGSRMCAGYLLGNKELYILMMRIISCYKIVADGHVDCGSLSGIDDPTSLVTTPKRYSVYFMPRDKKELRRALNNHIPVQIS